MTNEDDSAKDICLKSLSELSVLTHADDVEYLILAWFDDMLSAGRFSDIDKQLESVNLTESSTSAIVSILIGISWAPHGTLPSGQGFYKMVAAEIDRRDPTNASGLLSGLKWEDGKHKRLGE